MALSTEPLAVCRVWVGASVLACALLLLVPCAGRSETRGARFGAEFSVAESTPVAEITAHPGAYFNHKVRAEGLVASVDAQDGSFIEMVPATGGECILVSLHETGEHFPSDCAGARAIVEGTFYRKVYPASRVLRWQARSFRAGKRVPDFALISRISATAVEITEDRGRLPDPRDIEPAQTDRLDLARMEFEADGFGTGRKDLAPGDSTETHSSGNAQEIVLCLDGTLTVIRADHGSVELQPGEMTYIGPNTRHAIYNTSMRPAAYVFTYSVLSQ